MLLNKFIQYTKTKSLFATALFGKLKHITMFKLYYQRTRALNLNAIASSFQWFSILSVSSNTRFRPSLNWQSSLPTGDLYIAPIVFIELINQITESMHWFKCRKSNMDKLRYFTAVFKAWYHQHKSLRCCTNWLITPM